MVSFLHYLISLILEFAYHGDFLNVRFSLLYLCPLMHLLPIEHLNACHELTQARLLILLGKLNTSSLDAPARIRIRLDAKVSYL